MKLYITRILFFSILSVYPFKGMADEVLHDPASLEAMIDNHRYSQTCLEIRCALELSVRKMHSLMAEREKDRYKVERQLDRINRNFDILNIVLKGVSVSFKAGNTYTNIKKSLEGYSSLLKSYYLGCLKRGDIQHQDLQIYDHGKEMVNLVEEEVKSMWKSFGQLSQYVLAKQNCKTTDFLKVLNDINNNFDRINDIVSASYTKTWSYMSVRLGFWNKQLYSSKTVRQICESSYGRWRKEANQSLERFRQRRKVTYEPLGGGALLGRGRGEQEPRN